VLLTRLPLMSLARLIARLTCIKRAASVHPEPRSNSPYALPVAFRLQTLSLELTVSASVFPVTLQLLRSSPIRKPMPSPSSIGPGNLIPLSHSRSVLPLGILLPLCRVVYYTMLSCQATLVSVFRTTWPDYPSHEGQFYHNPFSCQANFLAKRL
jgi:hypothetical protein